MNYSDPQAPLLQMQGLSKTFSNGTVALHRVDLTVARGSVHGLVGANGAGKSTLIKILAGSHVATGGTVRWKGQETSWSNPGDAREAGIATLYQQVPVSPTLTVLENVFLGEGGWRRTSYDQRARFAALTDRIGYPIAPETVVGDLPIGQRQMVAMLQALAIGADLIVLDEPTAALSQSEREIVFDVVRRLSQERTSFLYVSHFLDEVLSLTDHVTILRDGAVTVSAPTAKLDEETIVTAIVGKKLQEVEDREPPATATEGPPLLEVVDLSVPASLEQVSLSLAPGEIVGLAGLLGSGRTELLEAIFKARKASGEVRLEGQKVGRGTPESVRAGLALVPEDRDQAGLIPVFDLQRNVTLPYLPSYSWRRMLPTPSLERHAATHAIEALSIRTPGPHADVTELSGGNAQKVVLGRWIHGPARVLLLDEPTAGVDVGAKADILELVRKFAEDGRAVLMASSEFEELLAVCHRILVLDEGRIVAERPGLETTEDELVALASGLNAQREEHVA